MRRLSIAVEPALAAGATIALGAGTMLALVGVATRAPPVAVGGAIVGATALGVLLTAGWLGGLALVALTLSLPTVYSDDTVRIAFVAPVAAVVVLAWALRRGVGRERLALGALPVGAVVLLFGAFVLTALPAAYPLDAAREVLNITVLLALLAAATDALSPKGEAGGRGSAAEGRLDAHGLAALIAGVAGVCGVLAALEAVNVVPGRFPLWGSSFYRASLGFGQPNGLGLFLALALPLAVHRLEIARTGTGRVVAALAVAAVVLGLVATFSRGSWLAAVGGAGVLFLVGERRRALGIWLAALVIGVILDLALDGAVRERLARTFEEWVFEQRVALMLAGVLMFLAHPLVGVGPGGFAPALERFGAELPQLWDYLPTPHNAFIQMGAESGVLGLFALVVFIWAVLRVLVRRARAPVAPGGVTARERGLRRAVLWAFATAVLACFVVWPFAHGPGEALVLVIAMGMRREA